MQRGATHDRRAAEWAVIVFVLVIIQAMITFTSAVGAFFALAFGLPAAGLVGIGALAFGLTLIGLAVGVLGGRRRPRRLLLWLEGAKLASTALLLLLDRLPAFQTNSGLMFLLTGAVLPALVVALVRRLDQAPSSVDALA